ncbi:MAG TPA: XylR N-terminal domain-containing protein, partial [Anaeromyxobacteraceae bacterium]|nr:XylR N-terminal domain-containing protein [Anaeromyxobacteraceae bacterium]
MTRFPSRRWGGIAMRLDDLDYRELLLMDPAGGAIRFAGERALVLDPIGMGLLRRQLVDALGFEEARALITRVAFARGVRLAAAVERELEWDREEDRPRGAARLLALAGLFRLTGADEPLASEGVVAEASYEAEQHLAHLGRSDVAVCWTTCGLLSGLLSRMEGRRIYVLEGHCAGKGDAACRLLARPAEAWGAEHAAALRGYESA